MQANQPLSEFFAEQISNTAAIVRAFPEADAGEIRHGTWTAKQILGHLIDSAANNHMRFVRGALQTEYHGPTYQQNLWVNLHDYQSLPWAKLVAWWSALNEILVQVVRNIPVEKYAVPCFVETQPDMTLDELVRDYVAHMQHHVEQLCTPSSS